MECYLLASSRTRRTGQSKGKGRKENRGKRKEKKREKKRGKRKETRGKLGILSISAIKPSFGSWGT